MKLELKNVTKKYDLDTLGIEGVSFCVENGTIGVAGEAGAGKFTLLGVIGGILDIDGGELLMDGKLMNDVSPAGRDALLVSGGKLPLRGSVERNLTYGLRLRGMRKDEAAARAREAAELAGVSGLLHRSARSLNAEERARAEIARIAARRPKVALINDICREIEDESVKRDTYALLRRVREHIGDCVAVVAVSDGSELSYIGGQAAIMRGGTFVRVGRTEDVFSDPGTAYVARFIASCPINVFRTDEGAFAVNADDMRLTEGSCRVVGSGGGYTLLLAEEGMPPVVVRGETDGDTAGFIAEKRIKLTEETRKTDENEENGPVS